MVQASQAFDEHIDALVPEFIASRREKVQGIVQIEIVMAIEMAPNEVINFLFGL